MQSRGNVLDGIESAAGHVAVHFFRVRHHRKRGLGEGPPSILLLRRDPQIDFQCGEPVREPEPRTRTPPAAFVMEMRRRWRDRGFGAGITRKWDDRIRRRRG